MINLIANAIPFFLISVAVEAYALRHHSHDHHAEPGDEPIGYDLKDTRTSLAMGIGNVVINVGLEARRAGAYAALYELTPCAPADPTRGGSWVAALLRRRPLLLLVPPRLAREPRLLGHPRRPPLRQHYNLSTALRQTWVPMTYAPFWSGCRWLLGFPPWMVLLAQAWSLIYQFWIHTERDRAAAAAGRGRASTRRRTTASTTAPTSSTWTRTTPAS